MNMILAFRSLFKKKQSNFIKITSLGIGLAAGLILATKVLFELSYDSFYPDSDRIYLIQTYAQMGDDPEMNSHQVSGAIAPGMKYEIPEIVAATRFTDITRDAVLITQNKSRLTGTVILADSCFFDVVPRPILLGSAKEVLSFPMQALISSDMAKKMGNDVVGQTIVMDNYPGREIFIGGVFEALPLNSSFSYDVIVSMSSISRFMQDGTNNWFGNDRYTAFVKLQPNTDPAGLAPAIRQMQVKYQDIEMVESQYGVKLNYYLTPITKVHSSSDKEKSKIKLLGWIAFSLIFVAVLNYVLIVISTYVRRAKEMAVYKSYGADKSKISKKIYWEVFVHLFVALCVAALSVFLFNPVISELLEVPVSALLNVRSLLLLLVVSGFIFIVTGLIPARLFSSIPVASAFRSFKQSRRSWMLTLLFIQLAAATFLVTLLVVIGLQYRLMVNFYPGYDCGQTVYCTVNGATNAQRETALEMVARLPDVQATATARSLLFRRASGNNVSLVNDDRELLFNIADLYGVDENYLSLMEIAIIEGKGFERGVSTERDMIVSRSFAQRIIEITGWRDGVVGKDLVITEHGPCRVVGVYGDVRIGIIGNEDKRPSAMFYAPVPARTILIRFHQLSGEGIQKAVDVLQSAMPDKDIVVTPYKESMLKGYNELRLFRNSVMAGSIIALVLSLIGLLAYLRSEINRRSAEIAIRKVNGATIADVLVMFAKSIVYLSVPALAAGAAVSAYVAGKMMESYSEKINLTLFLFIACCLFVLVVTLGFIIAGCWRVATQNPVEKLKTE